MPLLNLGRSVGERDLRPSNRVELSFMTRGEEYRMNAMAERHVGGLDAAMRNVMRSAGEEQVGCGNATCRSSWTLPWKSRTHPIFEEKWACSGKCLLAMVKVAIAREVGDGRRDGVNVQHQHRIPLGLVMLSQGWITHPQLQKALEAQRAGGVGRIGDWLVSECGLEAEVVTRGLSVQWGCPVLTTEGFSPTTMAMALPRVFIEKFGILPLRIAGSKILYVGFEDHLDASSAFAAEQMSGLRTESGVVVEERFREAKERLLDCQFAPATECRVPDHDTLAKAIATVIDRRHTVDSRLVRLRQYYWLRAWTAGGRYLRGGNLPTKADHAGDYLFTIGKSL
jgi:hypothetical protein